MVGPLYRQRAASRSIDPARPLQRHCNLPQGDRNLRFGRDLELAHVARSDRHRRARRHSAAAQRAPLLCGGNHPRRIVDRGLYRKGESVPPGCTLPGDPASEREILRVAQKRLVDWVTDKRQPPPNRYPMLAKGDLVPPAGAAMGWPAIPNVPHPDGKQNPLADYDFGPGFIAADVSGAASRQPPVPRVNADGNETAGVLPIQLQVPTGTFTGWNVTAKGYGAGAGAACAAALYRLRAPRPSARPAVIRAFRWRSATPITRASLPRSKPLPPAARPMAGCCPTKMARFVCTGIGNG